MNFEQGVTQVQDEEAFGAGADGKPQEERGELVEATVLNFALALGHETRLKLLLRYSDDGPASAQMMFKRGISTLGVCAYHNSQLKRAGAIHEVGNRPRRGATEHFYDLTDFGRACLKVASTISAYDG